MKVFDTFFKLSQSLTMFSSLFSEGHSTNTTSASLVNIPHKQETEIHRYNITRFFKEILIASAVGFFNNCTCFISFNYFSVFENDSNKDLNCNSINNKDLNCNSINNENNNRKNRNQLIDNSEAFSERDCEIYDEVLLECQKISNHSKNHENYSLFSCIYTTLNYSEYLPIDLFQLLPFSKIYRFHSIINPIQNITLKDKSLSSKFPKNNYNNFKNFPVVRNESAIQVTSNSINLQNSKVSIVPNSSNINKNSSPFFQGLVIVTLIIYSLYLTLKVFPVLHQNSILHCNCNRGDSKSKSKGNKDRFEANNNIKWVNSNHQDEETPQFWDDLIRSPTIIESKRHAQYNSEFSHNQNTEMESSTKNNSFEVHDENHENKEAKCNIISALDDDLTSETENEDLHAIERNDNNNENIDIRLALDRDLCITHIKARSRHKSCMKLKIFDILETNWEYFESNGRQQELPCKVLTDSNEVSDDESDDSRRLFNFNDDDVCELQSLRNPEEDLLMNDDEDCFANCRLERISMNYEEYMNTIPTQCDDEKKKKDGNYYSTNDSNDTIILNEHLNNNTELLREKEKLKYVNKRDIKKQELYNQQFQYQQQVYLQLYHQQYEQLYTQQQQHQEQYNMLERPKKEIGKQQKKQIQYQQRILCQQQIYLQQIQYQQQNERYSTNNAFNIPNSISNDRFSRGHKSKLKSKIIQYMDPAYFYYMPNNELIFSS